MFSIRPISNLLRNRLCQFVLAALFIASADAGRILWAAPPPNEPMSPPTAAAIRQALGKRVELKYEELPLNEVAKDLQAKVGIPVHLDTKGALGCWSRR